MNLAQLLDPERLHGQDPLARKPAPLPPMGLVTYAGGTKYDPERMAAEGIAAPPAAVEKEKPRRAPAKRTCAPALLEKVRAFLAEHPASRIAEIVAAIGTSYSRAQIYNGLSSLERNKHVTSKGRYGERRCTLTAAGRAAISPP